MKKENKKVMICGMEITKDMLLNDGGELSVIDAVKKYGINYKILDELLMHRFGGSICNGYILQKLEENNIFFDVESGEGDAEQTMIIDENGADFLKKYTNETVFYSNDLNLYLWGKKYFNMEWDGVDTGIEFKITETDVAYHVNLIGFDHATQKIEKEIKEYFEDNNIYVEEIYIEKDENGEKKYINYHLIINDGNYFDKMETDFDTETAYVDDYIRAILHKLCSECEDSDDEETQEVFEILNELYEEV